MNAPHACAVSVRAGPSGPVMQSGDFERVLRCRPCARTPHFMLHHAPTGLGPAELSTDPSHSGARSVDKQDASSLPRLGVVIPKRLAKRAVTRNLIRRQIRSVWQAEQGHLRPGDWVVRLRSVFERTEFPSAASDALRHAARTELVQLFASVGLSRP